MEKLSKQLEALVTNWKTSMAKDEFFVARIRLTFYYFITSVFILGGSSIILYRTILLNFTESIKENVFINHFLAERILARAKDILLNRFITIDIIILIFIVILGFFLTKKTLSPISLNMQKQKRFIADASHELRTPIAVMISGLEVNLNNKNLDFQEAKELLEDTLSEMKNLSKLSNELLSLSKDDSSQTIYEPVDMERLISESIEKNRNLAQVKNINIEQNIKFKKFVLGNERELERVLLNVLDNAIKYTMPEGKIDVYDKVTFNRYVINITDNGVGIKEDLIDKIFDPFFRADLSRNTEGAGLGLALAKKIVEEHKGTIVVKSEFGKGTNVIISLPILDFVSS